MVATALVRGAPRWLLAASLAGGGWLLSNCSGAHEPAQRSPEAAVRPRANITPTANVPALLGKPIGELQRRLGAAQPLPVVLADVALYNTLAPLSTDSVMVFQTGGLLLAASYNTLNRSVYDLLLLGHHEDSLMHRATLRTDAPGYVVLPLFRPDRPGALLGLRVIPAARK